MSDEEKNKTPKTDESQIDDDLDSLSQEEKSAFEKIMAEIAAAEGKPGEASATTSTPGPEGNDSPAESPKDPPSSDDDPGAATASVPDQAPGASDTPSQTPSAPDGNEDELTDDQQAALDKIMGEIKADKSADPPPAAEEPASEKESDDELTEDQQAALDKIMADINDRKDTAAAAVSEPEQPSEDADEELSDEQQAALDKIMTEINDRKEADAPQTNDEPSTEEASDDELTEDQQAALDKIMADINAADPAGSDAAETSEKTDPSDADLTIDEFNEELTNLLKSADDGASESDPGPSQDDAESEPHEDLKTDPVDETAPADGSRQPEGEAPPSDAQTPPQRLKEVAPSPDTDRSTRRRDGNSTKQSRLKKKVWRLTASVSVLIALTACSFWAYRLMVRTPVSPTRAGTDVNHSPAADEAVDSIATVSQNDASIPKQDPEPPSTPMASPFAQIRQDLETARAQLQKKKQELQDLKVYYQNGIQEERSKIAAKTVSAKIDSFRAAVRDNQVELALHSIQRRKIYLAKLDTPMNQIDAALEELLYWQRRTQLLELLSKGISGLPVSEFKQEVTQIMQQHIEQSQTLSIENIQVATPKLAAIWEELATHDTGGAKPSIRSAPPSQKDIDIAKEICDGNYEHLYLLSHLSDKTAACLARWSGKDLYLNELTQLTPAVAKSLAKWPGEWLSLNGIQSLPAESAKHLAQWPGKRLSLNGVKRLSKNATAYLSQWQGEQLEMVGLNSIGRWENYVTRLYLSEELRRKLEMD